MTKSLLIALVFVSSLALASWIFQPEPACAAGCNENAFEECITDAFYDWENCISECAMSCSVGGFIYECPGCQDECNWANLDQQRQCYMSWCPDAWW